MTAPNESEYEDRINKALNQTDDFLKRQLLLKCLWKHRRKMAAAD